MYNFDRLSSDIAQGVSMIGFQNKYLHVVGYLGVNNRRKKIWQCICKCGKEIIRETYQIKNSVPKSCGCYIQKRHGNINYHDYHTKHGLANKHPLYRTWKNIKQRCYNPKNKDYKNYGLKGIKVCDQWKNDFKIFFNWCIDNGWQKGLSIDRINSKENYSPINCQFLTPSENSKKIKKENPDLNVGSNHKDATLNEEIVTQIKKLLLDKIPDKEIKQKFNIKSKNILYQIKTNKTWKSVII